MGVKSLKNLNHVADRLITTPSLGDINRFKYFVDNSISKYNLSSLIKNNLTDFKKIYDEIISAWNQGGGLHSLNTKTFRKIPIIFTITFPNSEPLLKVHNFLESYLKLIQERNDYRSARKLFKAILRSFHQFKDRLKLIFETISPMIKNSDNTLCKKLASIDERYHIMSVDIIEVICNQILLPPLPNEDSSSIDSIFANLGISPDLQEGELGEEIGKQLLHFNQSKLTSGDYSSLERTLEYFIKDVNNKTLRLDHMHDHIIESLLTPFVENDPAPDQKDRLSKFIDNYFGDPRGNPRWTTVKDEVKRIPIRWKVGVTLSAFFKLLDDVALENEVHAKHWPMRKAFWKGLLDQGEIHEAWIVLGKRYLEVKESYLTDDINFAKFSSHKNIEQNHCAILLRVRGYTITEWSHNGATRIYDANDPKAPDFYQDSYHPDELKTLRRKNPGMGSPNDGYVAHSPTTWKKNIEKKLGMAKRVTRKVQR